MKRKASTLDDEKDNSVSSGCLSPAFALFLERPVMQASAPAEMCAKLRPHLTDAVLKDDLKKFEQQCCDARAKLALSGLFSVSSYVDLVQVTFDPSLPLVPYQHIVRHYNNRQSIEFASEKVPKEPKYSNNEKIQMSEFSINLCAGTSAACEVTRVSLDEDELSELVLMHHPLLYAAAAQYNTSMRTLASSIYLFCEVFCGHRNLNEVSEVQRIALLFVQEVHSAIVRTGKYQQCSTDTEVCAWPNTHTMEAKVAARKRTKTKQGDGEDGGDAEEGVSDSKEVSISVCGRSDLCCKKKSPSGSGTSVRTERTSKADERRQRLQDFVRLVTLLLELKCYDHVTNHTTLGMGPKSQMTAELLGARQHSGNQDARVGFLTDLITGQLVVLRQGPGTRVLILSRAVTPQALLLQLVLSLAVPAEELERLLLSVGSDHLFDEVIASNNEGDDSTSGSGRGTDQNSSDGAGEKSTDHSAAGAAGAAAGGSTTFSHSGSNGVANGVPPHDALHGTGHASAASVKNSGTNLTFTMGTHDGAASPLRAASANMMCGQRLRGVTIVSDTTESAQDVGIPNAPDTHAAPFLPRADRYSDKFSIQQRSCGTTIADATGSVEYGSFAEADPDWGAEPIKPKRGHCQAVGADKDAESTVSDALTNYSHSADNSEDEEDMFYWDGFGADPLDKYFALKALRKEEEEEGEEVHI